MTLTGFAHLRAYWWNSTKKGKVEFRLRDFRPRNSIGAQTVILGKLAYAALELAKKNGNAKEVAECEQRLKPYRQYSGLLGQPEIIREPNMSWG